MGLGLGLLGCGLGLVGCGLGIGGLWPRPGPRGGCGLVNIPGFRTRRSCLTNLLEFLDLVSDYVDEGIPVDAVYLDFQKAFEKGVGQQVAH